MGAVAEHDQKYATRAFMYHLGQGSSLESVALYIHLLQRPEYSFRGKHLINYVGGTNKKPNSPGQNHENIAQHLEDELGLQVDLSQLDYLLTTTLRDTDKDGRPNTWNNDFYLLQLAQMCHLPDLSKDNRPSGWFRVDKAGNETVVRPELTSTTSPFRPVPETKGGDIATLGYYGRDVWAFDHYPVMRYAIAKILSPTIHALLV